MNSSVRLVLITVSVVTLLVCFIPFIGRTRPGDHPISSNCTWVEGNTRPLTLENRADRAHLRDDAVTAEDVAIRWADKYFAHLPEYEARRNECMETLFAGVANQHGLNVALVRQYRLERDVVADSVVVLSFGLLYGVVAYVFAGQIRKRFSFGEPGFWVLTLTLAIGMSLVGVMIGNLWSIVVEGVRLNSGHLSYRMDRIPFRDHWAVLFMCGILVFGLATLVRARFKADDAGVKRDNERLRITFSD